MFLKLSFEKGGNLKQLSFAATGAKTRVYAGVANNRMSLQKTL